MDLSIAAILAQDGITSGAIYALLALALVLVFSVTRVIFIPQVEFVAFGALTMAALQADRFPLSATLLVVLGILSFAQEAWAIFSTSESRLGAGRSIPLAFLKFVLLPIAVFGLTRFYGHAGLPMALQVLLSLAIVVPMGAMIYRLAFQPLAEASTLVLLIVAVAVHYALIGIGLLMFGAEGSRTTPFSDARFEIGSLAITGQSVVIVGVSVGLILALYIYFERTLSGKALQADRFPLSAALGALCGVLIAPLTTVYYDSGFLIGLKGFVGAIIGGLGSYPIGKPEYKKRTDRAKADENPREPHFFCCLKSSTRTSFWIAKPKTAAIVKNTKLITRKMVFHSFVCA